MLSIQAFGRRDGVNSILKVLEKCIWILTAQLLSMANQPFSYDVTSGSEIKPCIKVDKPLVVYRFLGNVIK